MGWNGGYTGDWVCSIEGGIVLLMFRMRCGAAIYVSVSGGELCSVGGVN